MTDAKHETIVIPIDAKAVARYRFAQSMLGALLVGVFFGFFAFALGMGRAEKMRFFGEMSG